MIHVSALRGAREFLVGAHVRAASRRLETPVGVVAELEREPSGMGSLSEGRPLIVLGRASTGSHERLKPTGVDELETGQIDGQMRRVARLRMELPVAQGRGGYIERAAQPEG